MCLYKYGMLQDKKSSPVFVSLIFKVLRGLDYDGSDRSVDVSVSRLRKKLGDDPACPARIKTIWSKGYLFVKDAW